MVLHEEECWDGELSFYAGRMSAVKAHYSIPGICRWIMIMGSKVDNLHYKGQIEEAVSSFAR